MEQILLRELTSLQVVSAHLLLKANPRNLRAFKHQTQQIISNNQQSPVRVEDEPDAQLTAQKVQLIAVTELNNNRQQIQQLYCGQYCLEAVQFALHIIRNKLWLENETKQTARKKPFQMVPFPLIIRPFLQQSSHLKHTHRHFRMKPKESDRESVIKSADKRSRNKDCSLTNGEDCSRNKEGFQRKCYCCNHQWDSSSNDQSQQKVFARSPRKLEANHNFSNHFGLKIQKQSANGSLPCQQAYKTISNFKSSKQNKRNRSNHNFTHRMQSNFDFNETHRSANNTRHCGGNPQPLLETIEASGMETNTWMKTNRNTQITSRNKNSAERLINFRVKNVNEKEEKKGMYAIQNKNNRKSNTKKHLDEIKANNNPKLLGQLSSEDEFSQKKITERKSSPSGEKNEFQLAVNDPNQLNQMERLSEMSAPIRGTGHLGGLMAEKKQLSNQGQQSQTDKLKTGELKVSSKKQLDSNKSKTSESSRKLRKQNKSSTGQPELLFHFKKQEEHKITDFEKQPGDLQFQFKSKTISSATPVNMDDQSLITNKDVPKIYSSLFQTESHKTSATVLPFKENLIKRNIQNAKIKKIPLTQQKDLLKKTKEGLNISRIGNVREPRKVGNHNMSKVISTEKISSPLQGDFKENFKIEDESSKSQSLCKKEQNSKFQQQVNFLRIKDESQQITSNLVSTTMKKSQNQFSKEAKNGTSDLEGAQQQESKINAQQNKQQQSEMRNFVREQQPKQIKSKQLKKNLQGDIIRNDKKIENKIIKKNKEVEPNNHNSVLANHLTKTDKKRSKPKLKYPQSQKLQINKAKKEDTVKVQQQNQVQKIEKKIAQQSLKDQKTEQELIIPSNINQEIKTKNEQIVLTENAIATSKNQIQNTNLPEQDRQQFEDRKQFMTDQKDKSRQTEIFQINKFTSDDNKQACIVNQLEEHKRNQSLIQQTHPEDNNAQPVEEKKRNPLPYIQKDQPQEKKIYNLKSESRNQLKLASEQSSKELKQNYEVSDVPERNQTSQTQEKNKKKEHESNYFKEQPTLQEKNSSKATVIPEGKIELQKRENNPQKIIVPEQSKNTLPINSQNQIKSQQKPIFNGSSLSSNVKAQAQFIPSGEIKMEKNEISLSESLIDSIEQQEKIQSDSKQSSNCGVESSRQPEESKNEEARVYTQNRSVECDLLGNREGFMFNKSIQADMKNSSVCSKESNLVNAQQRDKTSNNKRSMDCHSSEKSQKSQDKCSEIQKISSQFQNKTEKNSDQNQLAEVSSQFESKIQKSPEVINKNKEKQGQLNNVEKKGDKLASQKQKADQCVQNNIDPAHTKKINSEFCLSNKDKFNVKNQEIELKEHKINKNQTIQEQIVKQSTSNQMMPKEEKKPSQTNESLLLSSQLKQIKCSDSLVQRKEVEIINYSKGISIKHDHQANKLSAKLISEANLKADDTNLNVNDKYLTKSEQKSNEEKFTAKQNKVNSQNQVINSAQSDQKDQNVQLIEEESKLKLSQANQLTSLHPCEQNIIHLKDKNSTSAHFAQLKNKNPQENALNKITTPYIDQKLSEKNKLSQQKVQNKIIGEQLNANIAAGQKSLVDLKIVQKNNENQKFVQKQQKYEQNQKYSNKIGSAEDEWRQSSSKIEEQQIIKQNYANKVGSVQEKNVNGSTRVQHKPIDSLEISRDSNMARLIESKIAQCNSQKRQDFLWMSEQQERQIEQQTLKLCSMSNKEHKLRNELEASKPLTSRFRSDENLDNLIKPTQTIKSLKQNQKDVQEYSESDCAANSLILQENLSNSSETVNEDDKLAVGNAHMTSKDQDRNKKRSETAKNEQMKPKAENAKNVTTLSHDKRQIGKDKNKEHKVNKIGRSAIQQKQENHSILRNKNQTSSEKTPKKIQNVNSSTIQAVNTVPSSEQNSREKETSQANENQQKQKSIQSNEGAAIASKENNKIMQKQNKISHEHQNQKQQTITKAQSTKECQLQVEKQIGIKNQQKQLASKNDPAPLQNKAAGLRASPQSSVNQEKIGKTKGQFLERMISLGSNSQPAHLQFSSKTIELFHCPAKQETEQIRISEQKQTPIGFTNRQNQPSNPLLLKRLKFNNIPVRQIETISVHTIQKTKLQMVKNAINYINHINNGYLDLLINQQRSRVCLFVKNQWTIFQCIKQEQKTLAIQNAVLSNLRNEQEPTAYQILEMLTALPQRVLMDKTQSTSNKRLLRSVQYLLHQKQNLFEFQREGYGLNKVTKEIVTLSKIRYFAGDNKTSQIVLQCNNISTSECEDKGMVTKEQKCNFQGDSVSKFTQFHLLLNPYFFKIEVDSLITTYEFQLPPCVLYIHEPYKYLLYEETNPNEYTLIKQSNSWLRFVNQKEHTKVLLIIESVEDQVVTRDLLVRVGLKENNNDISKIRFVKYEEGGRTKDHLGGYQNKKSLYLPVGKELKLKKRQSGKEN